MPMNLNRILGFLVLFCLLFGVTQIFSYSDMRPVDGPLQVGFPMTFYTLPSGFQSDANGINASWDILAMILNAALVSLVAWLLLLFIEKRSTK